MSILNYFVDKLKSGLITFINMVTLAHRDFPYHDYTTFADGDEPAVFTVGENNKASAGDQTKLFVSKSTLIYATGASTVRFNNMNNVAIAIIANTLYEFKSNIHQVFVTAIATDANIYIYCEGVLPQEARSPL